MSLTTCPPLARSERPPGDGATIPATASSVARFYTALQSGDASGAMATLAPEVVLHVPGSHPLAGDHHGPAGVLAFAAATRAATVDGERIELVDLLEGERVVAALCRVRATRHDGARLDNQTLHLMRPGADGRIAEVWLHNLDQAHVDSFWSAP